MGSVPIYYEFDEPDNQDGPVKSVSEKKRDTEQGWQYEPRTELIHIDVPKHEWIVLFPDDNYGKIGADLKNLEKAYNEDRYHFYQTDYHTPELIPAAEYLQDSLDQMLAAAVYIFDEYGSPKLQECALALMDRVCKDSYAAGEKVSGHVKWMLQQFPEDDILREDLKDIDEAFTDFYLEAYSILIKNKKKIAAK